MNATPKQSTHVQKNFNYRRLAQAVIESEARAVAALVKRADAHFANACEMMLACEGRIVVLGMGKSGHIGGKVAATLASTGTPAFFVHPGEASHGDLGMITAKDVVLAFSNSGETDEILVILPLVKRLGVPLIALTGNKLSTLSREADAHIHVGVEQEACPLGLAPTSSSTAALVMGDALAIALLQARGFSADDFARSHPGGRLGRRLLLHVENVMRSGAALPTVEPHATVSDALMEITRKGMGMTAVVDNTGLLGVFTDGDLRRALDLKVDVHHTPIANIMTTQCITAKPTQLAAEALQIMETEKVNGLLVVDSDTKQLVGALSMHDLLNAGVI